MSRFNNFMILSLLCAYINFIIPVSLWLLATGRANNSPIAVHTPDLYKFNVRVAHAIPVPGSTQLDYQVWTEGWTVALPGSKTMSFWKLKDTFRSAFQAQSIPYFERMTKPDSYGHWMLATNHLDVKKPAPQLWTVWDDDFTVADI